MTEQISDALILAEIVEEKYGLDIITPPQNMPLGKSVV